jgi:hypothetical protein
MLKTIQKSSVNRRAFEVYKKWQVNQSQYEIVSASVETGFFDSDTFTSQSGIITHSLYRSIKSKYYNQGVSLIELFGDIEDLQRLSVDRNIGNSVYVLALPQNLYGEQLKKESIILQDNDNESVYADDGHGNIVSDTPLYTLISIDFHTGEIIISDFDGEVFNGTITDLDLNTGLSTLTFGSDTDVVEIVRIDFQQGIIKTSQPLDFDGLSIDEQKYGNVFYDDGLLVFSNVPQFSNYVLDFRSTKTIYETEVLINVKAGEFNYSQNPTAVQVTLSGSYDFETTPVFNSFPAGTKKIKEVLDIKRREFFSGSVDQTVSGSWDDYFSSASVDPTGSYLSTYITTIGLYDKDGDMIAVAKLPTPIKNLPDYDLNFIVRFDT